MHKVLRTNGPVGRGDPGPARSGPMATRSSVARRVRRAGSVTAGVLTLLFGIGLTGTGAGPAGASTTGPIPTCVPAASGGTSCSVVFDYTGGPQTWTVPARATHVTLAIDGAQGAVGCGAALGGKGGTLAVTGLPATDLATGTVYSISVGQDPGACIQAGGWPDGGAAAAVPAVAVPATPASLGGGGGGSSAVSIGGQTFVAAGGGGGGGDGTVATINAAVRPAVAATGHATPAVTGGSGGVGGAATSTAGSGAAGNPTTALGLGATTGPGGGGGGGASAAAPGPGGAAGGSQPQAPSTATGLSGAAGISGKGTGGEGGAGGYTNGPAADNGGGGGGGGGGIEGGGGGGGASVQVASTAPDLVFGGGGGGGGGVSGISGTPGKAAIVATPGIHAGSGQVTVAYLVAAVPTPTTTTTTTTTTASAGAAAGTVPPQSPVIPTGAPGTGGGTPGGGTPPTVFVGGALVAFGLAALVAERRRHHRVT